MRIRKTEMSELNSVMRIDTHENNTPMRRALEKSGFRYCGIIRIFNGDARIAFQKSSQ